jgi:ribosomal protein S18 acetylase RimI-like enzyme
MTHALRPATLDDVATLVGLMRAFYAEDGHAFREDAARRALVGLLEGTAHGRVLVIETDGETAGYAAVTFGYSLEFHGRDAFLDELYVRPERRGAGLGRAAIERAVEICRAEGIGAIHLEVGAGNDPARRLYEGAGFVDRAHHLMTRRLG